MVPSLSLDRQAIERLQQSAYSALRRVSCKVAGSTVILSGTVPSYHLKQIAQEAVGTLPGVEHIENRIRVGIEGALVGWPRG